MSDAEQKDFVRAALQRIARQSGLLDAAKDARTSAPPSDDGRGLQPVRAWRVAFLANGGS